VHADDISNIDNLRKLYQTPIESCARMQAKSNNTPFLLERKSLYMGSHCVREISFRKKCNELYEKTTTIVQIKQ
jgi:hypothetical protein